ncbi:MULTISPECIES: hypothetical protein [unclassified Microbacterium]|uniref:hypothetical protein n=1 Tax=unclassified Microbacterium TaxID=2609290 RepID=UPI000A5DC70F|nr:MULTISPECIES: hypothetical protein [unclassified Microbacterium]
MPPLTPDEVKRALALIEKGAQLGGNYPEPSAMELARRVLTGELSPEDARVEMNEALQEIVKHEIDESS